MIVRTTPRLARLGPCLRDVVLVLFALVVAHDAVYAVEYGVGAGYARAMSELGHDAYWASTSLVVGVASAVVFVVAIGLIARLRRRALAADRVPGEPSYLHELAAVWLRLFPVVTILFGVQENIEHLATEGTLVGIGAIVGPGASVVLPVLAATTFGVAAIGSLLRWRIRVLVARIAAGAPRRYAKLAPLPEPRAWHSIAADVALRWILARSDAGRAPPPSLLPIVVAAA
jgi:hypothetical protein